MVFSWCSFFKFSSSCVRMKSLFFTWSVNFILESFSNMSSILYSFSWITILDNGKARIEIKLFPLDRKQKRWSPRVICGSSFSLVNFDWNTFKNQAVDRTKWILSSALYVNSKKLYSLKTCRVFLLAWISKYEFWQLYYCNTYTCIHECVEKFVIILQLPLK